MTITGITEENFTPLNPLTGSGNIVVQAFDKSEVATSKLLLKMGFCSIFTSQNSVFKKYDFSDLKEFLAAKKNIDWPFLTSDFEIQKFTSVPKYTDKYRLSKLNCILSYCEINHQTLLFMFKFGVVPMVINLINRQLGWIDDYLKNDKLAKVFPNHYDKNCR